MFGWTVIGVGFTIVVVGARLFIIVESFINFASSAHRCVCSCTMGKLNTTYIAILSRKLYFRLMRRKAGKHDLLLRVRCLLGEQRRKQDATEGDWDD